MKYRTKLYLALITTSVISILLCLGLSYFQIRNLIINELKVNVTSIAVDTAISLNKQDIKTVQTKHTSSSTAYQNLQRQLQQIRDVNRRSDTYVKFVYILSPLNNHSNQYEYLVDAEEKNSKDYSSIGQIAQEADLVHLNDHIKNIYIPQKFLDDQYGSWLVAYAPIYDANGKYLATLGVNLYATQVIEKLNALLIYALIAGLITIVFALLIGHYIAKRQSLSLEILHLGVQKIGKGDLTTIINLETKDEFGELAQEINQMTNGLQQREKIQQNFARYVSKHVMDSILQSGESLSLVGEKRKITLLFSDIRNFTHISEQYRPEQVVKYLNEYFSAMVEIIFRNNGVLDKFLGDGIMVEFGVPLEDENQELNAVNTAIEMIQGVKDLCKKWRDEGKHIPNIEIGIGIHTGMAVIGNIGSEKRFEYTAIGDTVNAASRIEQLTKELKSPILFSKTTAIAIQDKIKIKHMGSQIIRGKNEPIDVYTIDDNI